MPRKLFAFLRSMRFGIILLVAVVLCSLAGSLIPQGREAGWYIENYPNNIGGFVEAMGLHRLFSTWYFVTLIALLGLNLLLCSVIRFRRVVGSKERAFRMAVSMLELESAAGGLEMGADADPDTGVEIGADAVPVAETETGVDADPETDSETGVETEIDANLMADAETGVDADPETDSETGVGTVERLRAFLVSKRFKQHEASGVAVFYKHTAGYYGSFIVHLSMLLILALGGAVLGLTVVTDHTIMPNETLIFEDGTSLTLDNFRIADDTGRTEYESIIRVTSPGGDESGPQQIRVNHPLTFHSYKYYQHTYGITGQVTAVNVITGGWDVFYLTERSFLSGDGLTGIWYEALFPGYVEDGDGRITPLAANTAVYADPVYYVMVSDGSGRESKFVFPGDAIWIGDVEFTFNEPAYYPGIRVKRMPHPFLELLYASFVLMTVGFWLCFFYQPTVISISGSKYKIIEASSGVLFEIEGILAARNCITVH